nr:MAG TPA: hypothetical protein [Caudoviricetes sp.]
MDKIKITCTKEQREALDKMLRLGFCTSTTYSSIFQAKNQTDYDILQKIEYEIRRESGNRNL